ncbi:MAG: hypothetical protein HRT87_09780 [Legionellales bacterium]|nr:hypothetical protein [Legionellales bacterium]
MIKLDENYYLSNDSNSWNLNYEKVGEINKDTGKPTISKNIWYCGNLKNALKRYMNEVPKTCKDVIAIRLILGEVENTILKVTKDMK